MGWIRLAVYGVFALAALVGFAALVAIVLAFIGWLARVSRRHGLCVGSRAEIDASVLLVVTLAGAGWLQWSTARQPPHNPAPVDDSPPLPARTCSSARCTVCPPTESSG